MARLFRQHGVGTAREQAAQFHARESRRGRANPFLGLFQTHSFLSGSIDTDAFFPDRAKSITFHISLVITGASPVGVVFELGSAGNGLAVWIASADRTLRAAAGDSMTGPEGVGPVVSEGQRLAITFAIQPAAGKARLWVGSDLVIAMEGITAEWADSGDGSIAQVAGTVTNRIDPADRVPLSDAAVVSPLDAALGQVPRQFLEVS